MLNLVNAYVSRLNWGNSDECERFYLFFLTAYLTKWSVKCFQVLDKGPYYLIIVMLCVKYVFTWTKLMPILEVIETYNHSWPIQFSDQQDRIQKFCLSELDLQIRRWTRVSSHIKLESKISWSCSLEKQLRYTCTIKINKEVFNIFHL